MYVQSIRALPRHHSLHVTFNAMAAAYKNSPKWVKRMKELFDQSDLNKNGTLSIEDFYIWIEQLEKEVKPEKALLTKLREKCQAFWENVGLKPGVQLTKQEFVDRLAEISVVERAAYDRGEKTLFYQYTDAVFDAVDTSRDGFLQLSEYQKMMKASNFDADTAEYAFKLIDANHDGKLSRQELLDYNSKYWFSPDDPKAAGLYGPKYEAT